MSQPHTITITIAPNGKVTGEVKGVSGPTCTTLTAWLEEIGEVTVDRHTADYRKPEQQGLTRKVS